VKVRTVKIKKKKTSKKMITTGKRKAAVAVEEEPQNYNLTKKIVSMDERPLSDPTLKAGLISHQKVATRCNADQGVVCPYFIQDLRAFIGVIWFYLYIIICMLM
jgi:hypothetical protein